jgi:hypothetical protein
MQTLIAPPTADEEVLNNDAVLSMIAAELGEDLIVDKIKYSRCSFALSSADLAQLKRRGASDRIISSMLENQARRGRSREYDPGPGREVPQVPEVMEDDGSKGVLEDADTSVPPSQAARFCYHCGADVSEDSMQCDSCGKAL